MFRTVIDSPVKRSINLDKSAQKFENRSDRPLRISNPPRKIIKTKVAVICMNNFFLFG